MMSIGQHNIPDIKVLYSDLNNLIWTIQSILYKYRIKKPDRKTPTVIYTIIHQVLQDLEAGYIENITKHYILNILCKARLADCQKPLINDYVAKNIERAIARFIQKSRSSLRFTIILVELMKKGKYELLKTLIGS